MKKTVNIMTSCDDGLALYIMPQLASFAVSLKHYDINFYLFHSRIKPANVDALRKYAGTLDNITFNEVIIEDTAPYEALASHGGPWPAEAYYSLCCHEYLPAEADRVLYIDAGDAVIDGDIGPYYFGDFEGKSLIATLSRFTSNDAQAAFDTPERIFETLRRVQDGTLDFQTAKAFIRPFGGEDLSDPKRLEIMIRSGIFTAGCYVINVSQFRADGRSMNDYLYLRHVLCGMFPGREQVYYGDEGFMSAAFAGEIKYFGYPGRFSLGYAPYNFGIWSLDETKALDYTPVVLHFWGVNHIKPWKARFNPDELRKYSFGEDPNAAHAPFKLTAKQAELYDRWWEYCEMTPIYDELNENARIAGRALEENFLPMCGWYNSLADEYYRITR